MLGSRTHRGALGVTAEHDAARLGLVVHELRSPVAALTAIDAAFVHRSSEDGGRRELARLALAACRGIERIVADTSVASVRFQALDPRLLVADAVAAVRMTGAAIRMEIDRDVPMIEGDPERLLQALDNLLRNALAHAPDGSDVVVRVRRSSEDVLVSVSDLGVGIPAVDQQRIFEAGVRLDHSRPGSGLGLAVARTVAEAHGGSLSVESVSGEGATFTLAVPNRQ